MMIISKEQQQWHNSDPTIEENHQPFIGKGPIRIGFIANGKIHYVLNIKHDPRHPFSSEYIFN